MMPFTRKMRPELARLLSTTSRGVAVVAGVFCIAVATVLAASFVQVATLKPLDSPALAALRERYRTAPDDELTQQIRALDLAARRTWLTRQWQATTAGWMLAVGAAVLLLALRLSGALAKQLPRPRPEGAAAPRPRAARIVLATAGLVLLVGGLSASVLTGIWLEDGAAAGRPVAPGGAGRPGLVATEEYAANWPQFRGPGGNGIASPQDPPVDWDGKSGRNIGWKAALPQLAQGGHSSPVVWNDRVFLSGASASSRAIDCWNATTGEHLWQAVIPSASAATPPKVGPDTGYAASTMAVDGRAVYAVFATGDLVAVDFSGRTLWKRALGVPDMNYGYASSLALFGDALIVQRDQLESGRLMAVSTRDGVTLWEQPREVSSSWSSPIVVETRDGWRIFANGMPVLTAHDPTAKGRALWAVDGMMGENAPSPAYADGRVFAANQLLSMVAADASTGERLWEVYDAFPDVASPLAFDGYVVMAAGYGPVTCLDAANGDVLAQQEFKDGFWASPILAGGRIYALDQQGVMRIFTADKALRLLASPAIGEKTDATPAFHAGSIFIRGDRTLYCVRGATSK